MELNIYQKVAAQKAVTDALKKAAGEARDEADEALKNLYDACGSDRIKIEIDGQEVGTLSMRFSTEGYQVDDPEAFEGFCAANGLGRFKRYIEPAYMQQAVDELSKTWPEGIGRKFELDPASEKLFTRLGDTFVVEGTGEVVPGISPKPRQPIGTTLRGCKPDKVLPLLAKSPEALGQLMLEGE